MLGARARGVVPRATVGSGLAGPLPRFSWSVVAQGTAGLQVVVPSFALLQLQPPAHLMEGPLLCHHRGPKVQAQWEQLLETLSQHLKRGGDVGCSVDAISPILGDSENSNLVSTERPGTPGETAGAQACRQFLCPVGR